MDLTGIWLDLWHQVSQLWTEPIGFNQLTDLLTEEDQPKPPLPKCPYEPF